MLRGIVFIDFQNFQIAVNNLYSKNKESWPRLDFNLLPREIVKNIPNVDFLKAFLFIPKPDDFLMTDPAFLQLTNGRQVFQAQVILM